MENSKLTETGKGEPGDEQSLEHAHYFSTRQMLTKNMSWLANQSISHTLTFYGDCAEVCQDFTLDFSDIRNGCCITTMHRLTLPFHQRIFDKSNITVLPHPPSLSDLALCICSPFPRLMIPPFWHNRGDRHRSQAVLKTLT
jgi:hypothetical protein